MTTALRKEGDVSAEEKAEMQRLVSELKKRDVKNPDVFENIATVQYWLGDVKAAQETIAELPAKKMAEQNIQDLISGIQLSKALKTQLQISAGRPSDSLAIHRLDSISSLANSVAFNSPGLDSSI